MFTTGAHMSQYIFLITRTDPEQPKHRGLTMFLVPTDWPGVEVHALQTIGEERTNITYYGDVRLPDLYRIGPVNDGWTVVHGPLDQEDAFGQTKRWPDGDHGSMGDQAHADLCGVRRHGRLGAVPAVRPDGSHPIDDPTVRMRLGRVAADIEWAMCTEGTLGRVAGAELNLRVATELGDIIGAPASCPTRPTGPSTMVTSSVPTGSPSPPSPTAAVSRCSGR